MLGPVFRAYQPAPGRLVAVKQFRLGLSPDDAQRFAASLERIVAADLSHPGIATPIAAGLADASPYLALDFVAAESFDVVMRESGPAQPRDVVNFARQVAGALDAAAASSVVHGALHPRDVLLAHDDVRMTGLGIAQALESVAMAAPIRRPYAAPERMAGAPWDRRADIYSLGALAYEMLVGKRILATGSESAENLPLVDGADADRLRVVFAKALAEKAANRFETAMDFADALERALTPVSRTKSNGRRRRPADTPPAPDLELPLDIPLDTPPLGDATGPHVEISAIDAAMPPAEGADANAPDLTLQPRTGQPDLAHLDTRLDDYAPGDVPELALHAIEEAQAGRPSSRAGHGEHVLELDALDAATDRMAAARDTAPDGRELDVAAIDVSVPPLSADAEAGSPLEAIEQALTGDSPAPEVVRPLTESDVRLPDSGALANIAAIDAALDLQSSEATPSGELADLPLVPPADALPFSRIDASLEQADQPQHATTPPEPEAAEIVAPPSPADVPVEEPVAPEDTPILASSAPPLPEPAPAAPAARRDTPAHAATDVDDEDDEAGVPWDMERVRPREADATRWAEESPAFAIDAALDARAARAAAEPLDTDAGSAPDPERAMINDEDDEPVPVLTRSLSLGQESTAASSGSRPILLGIALGLLVGFAFGYGVGQWRTGSAGQSAANAPAISEPQTGATAGATRESARAGEPATVPRATSPAPAPDTTGQPPTPAAPAAGTPEPSAAARPAPVPPPAASARQADAGKLVIRTTPSGATVTIDGKDAGLTPVTATLQPGAHTIRLAHQGYVTAQRRVRITSQPAQPIDLELVARPAREVAATPAAPERASGALVLDSRPTGARVYVDGALVGTTPMQIDAITGGDHAVRFEMDGFGPWSTTAKVTAGGKTRVSGSLER